MTETVGNLNRSRAIEQGDPTDDPRSFRRALGQFATGVTVVATSAAAQRIGMAVNSFSAVSLDPPLVLWSVRKKSERAPSFLASGHFSINVLAEGQMGVAGLFSRPHHDHFAQLDWTAGQHGDPLLAGAIAHFECVNEAVLDGGDHHILLGRVERFARYDGDPLLFAQGQYGVSHSHPDLALTDTSPDASNAEHSEEPLFMSLLQATDHHMSELFQQHRHQVGVTLVTARILNRLFRGACTQEVLEQETFLGENAVNNALSELADTGKVARETDGTWALTDAGREVRRALRRNAEAFTAAQLRGIADTDLAAAERVLQILLNRSEQGG